LTGLSGDAVRRYPLTAIRTGRRNSMHPIFKVATATGLLFAGAAGLWLRRVENGLPDVSEVVDCHLPEGQAFAPMTTIPLLVAHAFLAAEDNDFYNHGAIDFPMMLRATGLDILHYDSGRHPVGASTITQQIVKNLIVGDAVSFDRKIGEALLALRIERRLTKDRILEIYLNEIFLGCHSHGVAEAALNYFGKPLNELSIDEAAFLGGLPRAPNHYSPLRHPYAARRRRNWVIDRMVEDGYLFPGQAIELKATPIRLAADHCDREGDNYKTNTPLGVDGSSGGPEETTAQ
jgi:membrane peptidoglycan carboxypeptidase